MDLSFAPPLQARSRRTFDAILEATETLLRSASFDDIGVAEIVTASGVSTGSFYARFASKDALIPVLYARYDDKVARRSANLVRQVEAALTLDEACAIVIDAFAAVLRENVNLMRAVVQLTRADPEAGPTVSGQRRDSHAAFDAALLRFASAIPREKAARAIRAAQFMAVSALREAILFPNAPFAAVTAAADDIENTAARMMAAYIQGQIQ